MGRSHRRFGKEFEAETLRLGETSSRSQNQVAEDFGIGLSTLRRWLGKRRERELKAPLPDRQEDLAAETSSLRRCVSDGANQATRTE